MENVLLFVLSTFLIMFFKQQRSLAEAIHHNQPDHVHEFHEQQSIRKNVERLTREEVYQLREALDKFEVCIISFVL